MNEAYNAVKDFLFDLGLWNLFILIFLKFLLGVTVALHNNEFKVFYIGNIFKNDLLKFGVIVGLSAANATLGIAPIDPTIVNVGLGAVLAVDVLGGITKNIVHLFPQIAENVPSAVREPSSLRLGNPRNLPRR